VARHLLDLASARVGEAPTSSHRAGQKLIVQVSQQDLANAVGTVREVVVRVLRELRQDGLVRTERDRIVLLEPARLIQEQGWNQGS
jgi:CRP/FNR family transcriptional regulator